MDFPPIVSISHGSAAFIVDITPSVVSISYMIIIDESIGRIGKWVHVELVVKQSGMSTGIGIAHGFYGCYGSTQILAESSVLNRGIWERGHLDRIWECFLRTQRAGSLVLLFPAFWLSGYPAFSYSNPWKSVASV